MRSYSLTHLADAALLRSLAAVLARDRGTTASLLAHLAEVDTRKLYLPAAYPTMHAYCVGALGLSEDAAAKRIQAARTARAYPEIFAALADGRLHLSAVVMLAPHLEPEGAGEMLAAAAHKSKAQIERLLAERFPKPDLETRLVPIAPVPNVSELMRDSHAPGHVGVQVSQALTAASSPEAHISRTFQHAPGQVLRPSPPAPAARLAPLSPERFALQVTLSKAAHEKLQYARALLSHAVPSGEIAQVLERAFDALIVQLERRRFAAASKPRGRRTSGEGRYVAASIRRAVWKRDQGRCTFMSASGKRCEERRFLEFDHIEPLARGGGASISGMRLRCRAHNQYEAERVYGRAFMRHKREAARRPADEARGQSARLQARRAPEPPPAPDSDKKPVAGSRVAGLGRYLSIAAMPASG